MTALLDMVKRHYRAMESGDLDSLPTLFASNLQTVSAHGQLDGLDAFRQMCEAFGNAAPDHRVQIVNHIEAGDTVVVECIYSGTQTGELATKYGTIAATGRPFEFPYVEIWRVQDGLCQSRRLYWDNGDFLHQLGAVIQLSHSNG